MKDLESLFKHLLRDMYYAENKILKALPEMAEKADSSDLKKAFEHHASETESHVSNLEKVFKSLDLEPSGETCDAMNGIIEESKHVMKECDDPDVCDAGMIAAAQAVEHYEISRYGTMIAWAQQLGMREQAELLKQNLEQEYNADKKLTSLAEAGLNRQAA